MIIGFDIDDSWGLTPATLRESLQFVIKWRPRIKGILRGIVATVAATEGLDATDITAQIENVIDAIDTVEDRVLCWPSMKEATKAQAHAYYLTQADRGPAC